MLLFHANVFWPIARLEHSRFLKVIALDQTLYSEAQEPSPDKCRGAAYEHHLDGHDPPSKNPTTSVLTAAILIYAFGAGITAAAGTRLALQLILETRFNGFSSQLQSHWPYIGISCHYLPVSGLGNLRACCLP